LGSEFFEQGVLFRKGLASNMWCARISRPGHTDTTDSPRKGKLHRGSEEVGEVQGKGVCVVTGAIHHTCSRVQERTAVGDNP